MHYIYSRYSSIILEMCHIAEFSRKIVSRAFFAGEIQQALRENNLIDFKFSVRGDLFECLPLLEKIMLSSCFTHQCTEACRRLACEKLAVADGFWKTGFRHCAAEVLVRLSKPFPPETRFECENRSRVRLP